MKAVKITCLVGFLIVIFGFCFYFFYWVQRPMYSLNMIRSAVVERNVEKFEEYVDLNSIYDKAYDEYVLTVVDRYSEQNNKNKGLNRTIAKALAVSAVKVFKGDVVHSLKETTIESIKGRDGKATLPDEKKTNAGTLFIKVADSICENNDLKGLRAEKIDVPVVTDGTAEGYAVFRNKEGGDPLTVKFRMKQTENGYWKIVEILNVREILNNVKDFSVDIDKLF